NIFSAQMDVYRPAGVIPKPKEISINTTIIFVFISGIIVIAVISIYILIHNIIIHYLQKQRSERKNNNYDIPDVDGGSIFSSYSLMGLAVFSVLCIFVAIAVIHHLIRVFLN